ncbi:MAG: hypothetical protein II467_06575 [Bacilli bacterium]|nr:hypothetical protein [Bacilli bacterium]
MLNVHLLKEGCPSRPNNAFKVGGFISLFLILASTLIYLLVNFVPDIKTFADSFRIVITSVSVEFEYVGIEFVKMMVCIPLSALGALIGSINLIRITNRKPFLSALHIIPGIAFIGSILGFVAYYFLTFLFMKLPFQFDLKILYYVYVFSILGYAGGIVFADIFAIFYNHINSFEFAPIYRAYKKAKREAKKNSERSLIRYNFRHYWKQRKYDELLALLLGVNARLGTSGELNDESYIFMRDKALKHVEKEKIAQLDELYESGQHDLLRKELASMELDRSLPREYIPEVVEKKEKKPVVSEPARPRTIEIDDGEETLTRYGRRQIEKGRKKAMREARKRHAY